MKKEVEVLKVGNETPVAKLAGAIAEIIRLGKTVELQAIGPKAVSQGVKAVAVAIGYTAPSGVNLVMRPAFREVEMADGEVKTTIVMVVDER